MHEERRRQIDDLFGRALDLPKEERRAFLASATEGDPRLLAAVERLLALEVESRDLFGSLADSRLEVGQRVGPYRLVEHLGQGGMGEVYRARREDDYHHEVAIKVIRPDFGGEETQRRFLVERQALAALEHPNIARLYDGGATDGGLPYLVMELIQGETIEAYCDARRLTVRRRFELFRQVCGAVDHAHRNLLVHCDLKASNVLVEADGGIKLLDFGIAKWLRESEEAGETLTRTGGIRPMTPSCASPEQVRGEAITVATDIYGLGILLFELLCGRLPYRLDLAPYNLAGAIVEQDPLFLSECWNGKTRAENGSPPVDELASHRGSTARELSRQLEGDLDAIASRALAKEPAMRYRSVRELGQDITRYLEGRAVLARQGGAIYRLGRLLRRQLLPPDVRRRRERLIYLGSVLLLGLLAVAAHFMTRPPRPCMDSSRHLVGVWDDARRSAVRRAFLATDLPFAAQAWSVVEGRFDVTAEAWVAMHRTTCEATHVHGEQSERALDARMTCLDRQRRSLALVVDLLAAADAGVVARAGEAFGSLEDIERCADLEELSPLTPLPEDEVTREQIRAVRALVEEQRVRYAVRRPVDFPRLDQAVDEARQLAHPPLLAQALFVRGDLRIREGNAAEAGMEDLEAALVEAVTAGDRRLQSRIYAALTKGQARRMGGLEIAERWSELALASLESLGEGHLDLRTEVADALGMLTWQRREWQASETWYRKALAAAIEADDLEAEIRIRTNLGMLSGRDELEIVLRIIEETYGPDHVHLARPLLTLAIPVLETEGLAAAEPLVRRSIRLLESTYGETFLDLGYPLVFLGQLLVNLDRPEEALEHLRRAERLLEGRLGDLAEPLGELHETLAEALYATGRFEEALRHAQSAEPNLVQRSEEHVSYQLLLALLLEIHQELGDESAARRTWHHLTALQARAPLGPSSNKVEILLALGEAELNLGSPRRGRELLEQALDLTGEHEVSRSTVERIRRALARVD